jgi:hypothetical protein
LALLIVNDHFLKEHFAGAVTGKLSDLAGIVFFPLFVVALLEVAPLVSGQRPRVLGITGLTGVVLATGLVFALTKTWPPATDAYRIGTGLAEWPAYAISDLLRGRGTPGLPSAHLVRDHSDLLVLPALMLPWWVGRNRILRWPSTEPATVR